MIVQKPISYVAPSTPGNASLQWIPQTTGEKDDGELRIKVSNEPDSKFEQFALTWSTDKGPLPGVTPEKVYVAPGQSKIVKISGRMKVRPDRLVLSGDAVPISTTPSSSPHPRVENVKILYIGPDDAEGRQWPALLPPEAALADTPRRQCRHCWQETAGEICSLMPISPALPTSGCGRRHCQSFRGHADDGRSSRCH